MEASEIKQLVEAGIDGAEALVSGAGDHIELTVIADSFADLNRVKRQQAVYSCINHLIESGQIHAVKMQTLTPAQWQEQTQQG